MFQIIISQGQDCMSITDFEKAAREKDTFSPQFETENYIYNIIMEDFWSIV